MLLEVKAISTKAGGAAGSSGAIGSGGEAIQRAGQQRGRKASQSSADTRSDSSQAPPPGSALSIEAKRQLVEIFDSQYERMANVFNKWGR